MQQNFTQPPNLPPVRTRRMRVAGQDFDIPDVQWLRDLVLSTQTWALATHNSTQINQVWRGPDLVAAATITVSYPYHRVTGSAAISTISAIATFSGGIVYLLNDGSWSLTTGGNIASTFVPAAGALVSLMFDAITQMWYIQGGDSLTIGDAIVGGTPTDVLFVGPLSVLAQDDNFQWVAASGLVLKKPISTYNAIATVSGGVPAEYATVDLTGQTAAIGATTIYAVPASGAGMYRISYVAKVTAVASTSSVLGGASGFQVRYTDATDSVVVTTAAGPLSNLNTTQAQVNGVIVVYAKASTNIQYLFDYTSVNAAEMAYNLHVKVEAL